jgi:hypothetical protein
MHRITEFPLWQRLVGFISQLLFPHSAEDTEPCDTSATKLVLLATVTFRVSAENGALLPAITETADDGY